MVYGHCQSETHRTSLLLDCLKMEDPILSLMTIPWHSCCFTLSMRKHSEPLYLVLVDRITDVQHQLCDLDAKLASLLKASFQHHCFHYTKGFICETLLVFVDKQFCTTDIVDTKDGSVDAAYQLSRRICGQQALSRCPNKFHRVKWLGNGMGRGANWHELSLDERRLAAFPTQYHHAQSTQKNPFLQFLAGTWGSRIKFCPSCATAGRLIWITA